MKTIPFLNILLSYISYNKQRFIVLKIEIKLIEIIVKDIIYKTLYIEIKSRIFNTKYKESIYKEV